MSEGRLCHTFEPVYDERSRVLVLGSFPSVKSRENGFYYGHPRNRFWGLLAAVFGTTIPQTTEQKKALLLQNGVALWDVAQSCEIVGSSDASIRDLLPNDVSAILSAAHIERILANGAAAGALFERLLAEKLGMHALTLPSTSPANASYDMERLLAAWREPLTTENFS